MINSGEENLLEQNPPPGGEHRKRIEFLAKVLAYGALADRWSPKFGVREVADHDTRKIVGEEWFAIGHATYSKQLSDYLKDKWDNQQPQASFLNSFGYLEWTGATDQSPRQINRYLLTPKAYALLDRPVVPPRVFISYCHQTSSAFALMLEYRLQAAGIPVFIDRSIPSGEDWHARLQTTIETCQYFVCLITPAALESEFVQQEILWAKEACRIPVWQPGFELTQEVESYPDWLKYFVESKQAIRVLEESAEAYHNAVEKLLNELGFAVT